MSKINQNGRMSKIKLHNFMKREIVEISLLLAYWGCMGGQFGVG